MAGVKNSGFREQVSPFLREKILQIADTHGTASAEYYALASQYVKSPLENVVYKEERRRHFESEVELLFEGQPLVGVERLYRRTILVEPTTVCAAHCRWCLRGQYPVRAMQEHEITLAARYIGSAALRDDIQEVLITGGDPLVSLPLLAFTLGELRRHAPNVLIVRIGTRLPFQNPHRINDAMVEMFRRHNDFRLEIGVNVNHPVEFWPESIEAIHRLQDCGIRLYNQHPLLKGVNDKLETLITLYALMREHGIEAHYLFHAIPLKGMSHHRTSLDKGLSLARALTSCGYFSGRGKPHFAILSDIGKIVLYDGVIQKRDPEQRLMLIQSGYRLEDRCKWNPGWRLPPSVVVGADGTMATWYLDGDDRPADMDALPAI